MFGRRKVEGEVVVVVVVYGGWIGVGYRCFVVSVGGMMM